jgi:magnesium transporter
MRRDFTRLPSGQTVGQALEWLRDHPPQARVIYFYVVDPDGRLQGVVPTRQLLLSPPQRPITDIMVGQVITLPLSATVLEACEFFIQYRLLAFPVVDEQRRLLGVVDVDLYTEELNELNDATQREDLFQLLGVRAADPQAASLLSGFRQRFPWLGCNLGAGILAAFLAGLYQKELDRVVALAFFIPVVLNLAESVSSQSVSLALEWLRGRPPSWKSMFARIPGELSIGLLLGAASGLVVGVVALAWLHQLSVAACLLGGIVGGVAGAAVLGIVMPVVLRLFHLEPRVAAGPIALAGADIVTLLVYFNLARFLLE